jgi:hypothetical protein
LQVSNTSFVQSRPSAGIQISANELLIFGGDLTTTFMLDVRDVSGKTVKVNPIKQTILQVPGKFSKQSDYIARVFGNFLYTIDGWNKNLHVYAIKDKIWNYSPLGDLGIK